MGRLLVETPMRRAIVHGATKEALFDAINAAAVPGGGVASHPGSQEKPPRG